jgi:hypothetical protein
MARLVSTGCLCVVQDVSASKKKGRLSEADLPHILSTVPPYEPFGAPSMPVAATATAGSGLSLGDPLPTADHASKWVNKEKSSKIQGGLRFKRLDTYFNARRPFAIMYNVVTQKTNLSLRLLEFVCTTHARRTGLVVGGSDGVSINVDAVYQDKLKANGKRFFDAFRRGDQMHRYTLCKHQRKLATTIGQMCFFKLVIESCIYDYATANFASLEQAMALETVHPIQRLKPGTRHRPCIAHVVSEQPRIATEQTLIVFEQIETAQAPRDSIPSTHEQSQPDSHVATKKYKRNKSWADRYKKLVPTCRRKHEIS